MYHTCHALGFNGNILNILLTECYVFPRKCCSNINISFIQRTHFYITQNNNTTVVLIWGLKQLKDFTLKFSINGGFFSQKAFLN